MAISRVLPYPDNRRGSTSELIFGQQVADPYRWLEDEKAPEVVSWMAEQDKLARSEIAKFPERDDIAKRLKEILYVDSVSAPIKRKNRYFYSRRHADKEKGIVYVKDGKAGKERVLFDPNAWSTKENVALGVWTPSQDGKKVAYATRKNNSDEATLYVIDVDTMKVSDVDVIEGAKYAYPSWTPQGDGFFYTWLPTDKAIKPADRPGFAEVRFHKLGTAAKEDAIIRERTGDSTKFIGAELSKDGRYLFLSIDHGWSGNELYMRDQTSKDLAWVPLATDAKAHYRAAAHKGQIFVMTDDGSPNWRIVSVDPSAPTKDKWKDLVAESKDRAIDTFGIVGGKLVIAYLEKASSRLELRSTDGQKIQSITLPGLGSVSSVVGDADDPEAYFAFESFTTPVEIHELSTKTAKTKLHSRPKVPVDSSKFTTEQVTYKSKDGTPITMFVVRPTGASKDGKGRMYLYGYGGFQVNETPSFWATIYPWLERGHSFAVPNLRGGAEYGEAWHQAGMKLKKQNVFDDFIGAAEYLIAEKYTSPEHLVIAGASNGGLLVGAAMTQRPELYAGVVCGVPLLDMVRYHQFGSGRTWIEEYGSAEDPAEFKALHAYSPYHRIEMGRPYPALLMMAADSDDRVDPMHARKFSAFVQDASTKRISLLRIEKNSGHGGADMRKAEVEKSADRLAFSLHVSAGADDQTTDGNK